jgi:hypothetical protein
MSSCEHTAEYFDQLTQLVIAGSYTDLCTKLEYATPCSSSHRVSDQSRVSFRNLISACCSLPNGYKFLMLVFEKLIRCHLTTVFMYLCEHDNMQMFLDMFTTVMHPDVYDNIIDFINKTSRRERAMPKTMKKFLISMIMSGWLEYSRNIDLVLGFFDFQTIKYVYAALPSDVWEYNDRVFKDRNIMEFLEYMRYQE